MHSPAYLVLLMPLVHPHGMFTPIIGTIYSWPTCSVVGLNTEGSTKRVCMYQCVHIQLPTDKNNNAVGSGNRLQCI